MQIEHYLKLAMDMRASDLHIVAGLQPSMRVDGELLQLKDSEVVTAEKAQEILFEFLTPEQKDKFEKQYSIDMPLFFNHLGNFRVNMFHQNNGIGAVFRIVPEKIPTLAELAAPDILKRLLMLPHGIILITGPTGSGKSTTLAAMVDFINSTRPAHIITVEDPIEYIHKPKRSSVNQLQIGRDTSSFSAALRSSLRQDPNVIMLGEMRDLESIRLALTAAETGHLVLATLHASTASITVSRIVDIFPLEERDRIRNVLSETIQGVICQSLVRRIKGGRTAAYEVLLATPAIRHLINQGMTGHLESTIQTSGDAGMFTLESSVRKLLMKGIISKSVANAVISARDSMKFSDAGDKSSVELPPLPKAPPTTKI
jgi:twitching motility protein PilT